MKQFKFFQKPVKGDLTMLDGQTIITMSYDDNFHITGGVGTPAQTDWDTPEGHNIHSLQLTHNHYRRRLYHINPAEYERQRQIREELRTTLREGGFTEEERIRYRNDMFQRMRNTNDDMERYFIGMDLNDNRIESTLMPKLNWYQRFWKAVLRLIS